MNLRILLTPLSRIYGAVADWRQNLYRRGTFESFDLNALTISVGNITVGGTGKTPLVAFIAEKLAERGAKVCILTRGYGRENPKERVLVSDGERILADAISAGDEPFELANKLLGKSLVLADANRAAAGKWAREKYGITAFILDDGFQHLRVKRDLDIVLIDATKPFEKAEILPAGDLREPLKNLQRADVVVISRANLVSKVEVSNLEKQIRNFAPNCKLFVSSNKFTKVSTLKSFKNQTQDDINFPAQNKAVAFCGLGNPAGFFKQLTAENFNVIDTESFPDHHFYSQSEISKLERQAINAGAEILLTTVKDAAKLLYLNFNLPCYVLESGLVFENESAFIEVLQTAEKR